MVLIRIKKITLQNEIMSCQECIVTRLHVFLEDNETIAKLKAGVYLTGFVYFTC